MGSKQRRNKSTAQVSDIATAPTAHLTVIGRAPHLTDREQETLHYIVAGYTSEKIGEKLFLSMETVVSHRKSIIKKLGGINIVVAVAHAFRYGIVS